MSPHLEATRLSVSTSGGRLLVGPVDLDLKGGQPLTILGETGAGKSLIAQALLGMLPDGLTATGEVALEGTRIDTLSPRRRARLWGRRLALLPQEPWRALDPTMKALEQVAETHQLVAGQKVETAAISARADFSALRLEGAEERLPGALSGGMAQRVAFAAARAGGAPVFLADEPTKGLDAALRDDVVRLLAAEVAEGAALLTITHDVAVARALGGDVLILRDGAIVEVGPADRVLDAPTSAYGRALVEADPGRWPVVAGPAPSGATVLSAEGLAVARGGHRLLSDFAMDLHAGERLAITGRSGSGKTSLLDTLAGLLVPAAGQVRRGADMGPWGLQKLYQDPPAAFPPKVDIGRTLEDLARRHDLPRGRIEGLMERLHLSADLLARRPDAVSGGELQRLALARVLALSPHVILADEPTSRLDPVTQRAVMEVIGEVAQENSVAVLLVTHNPDIATRWAHSTREVCPGSS
ncbi:Glutathione import ATP-binding protein GsiA (plasmid) [Sulfitobacter sp. THAF37]|uniref:ABC transporter ATP-binding protein n=1 Tax=Sulfitobacter sp. THAF37 TaxID=2587855 RepID=UPI0012680420|nr:ATP-binding cassette domain-containing protein [Sulfitobacter sp. THAF37]QFT60748.1 Glutathione import ATP-binding protein GsiA [Sulfitobacter sp. THAF37]